jgi:hypothetical protein
MNKTELTANFVLVGGIILIITGLIHICLGTPQLIEAVSQGLIDLQPIAQIDWESQDLSREEIELVWIVFGLDITIFGLITIFLISELKKGRKMAWNISLIIGCFYLIIGAIAALYFKAIHPADVLFPVAGLTILIPLIIYRKNFELI